MSLSRSARIAVATGVPWSLPQLYRWGGRLLAFAFCLTAAIFLTAVRLEITRSRYELSTLHQERQLVADEVQRLHVEAASLASAERIRSLAREQGFVDPGRHAIVLLDE